MPKWTSHFLPPSPLVSWPSFGNLWQNIFLSVKPVRKLWSVFDVVWWTELRRQGSSLLTSGAVVPSGLFFECHNATCPQTIHVSDSYDTLAHFLYPKLWSLGSLVGKLLLGSYRNVLKQRQNHCKVPPNIDCTITRLLQRTHLISDWMWTRWVWSESLLLDARTLRERRAPCWCWTPRQDGQPGEG